MKETELVQAAQNGKSEAMQKLYEESVDYIYRFVYSFGFSKEVTEDIVSESFTKSFEKIKQFKGKSSFKTWVYKIARNETYMFLKKKRGQIPLDQDKEEIIADPVPDMSKDETKEKGIKDKKNERLIKRILSKLPERYATVLRLRYILGYTIKECATELRLSEGNIKVIQNRALRKANNLINKKSG